MSDVRRSVSEQQLALYYMAVGIAFVHGGVPLPQTPSPVLPYLPGLSLGEQGEGSEGGEVRRGGSEGHPKKRKPRQAPPEFDPASVPIPPELEADEFREAWASRLCERREFAATAPTAKLRGSAHQTPSQVAGQLRSLAKVAAKWGIAAAVGCVERARDGHWQGVVFPEDLEGRSRGGARAQQPARPSPGSTSAQFARAAAIDEQEAPSIWGRS